MRVPGVVSMVGVEIAVVTAVYATGGLLAAVLWCRGYGDEYPDDKRGCGWIFLLAFIALFSWIGVLSLALIQRELYR
jgi:hypothetical protein